MWLFFRLGSAKRLQNLLCQSRPAVVPTDPLFYPYFVSLHRCNGSWGTHSPARFRCVPSAEENILVPVQFGREEKIVILKNHTKCKTECVVKKEDCPYPNRYDPVSCRCICNHATAPKDIQCGPLKRLVKEIIHFVRNALKATQLHFFIIQRFEL